MSRKMGPNEIDQLKKSLAKSRSLLDAAMSHLEVTFAEYMKLGESGRVKVELIWKDGKLVKVNVDTNKSYECDTVQVGQQE